MALLKTLQCGSFIFSSHAVNAMISRNITADEAIEVVEWGEFIANYSNDKPYPSMLLLSFIRGVAIHVVVAQNAITGQCILVTCYSPNPALWDASFKNKIK